MRKFFLSFILFGAVGIAAYAQESPDAAVVAKGMSAKFAAVPGVPDCLTLAVLKGDPDFAAMLGPIVRGSFLVIQVSCEILHEKDGLQIFDEYVASWLFLSRLVGKELEAIFEW